MGRSCHSYRVLNHVSNLNNHNCGRARHLRLNHSELAHQCSRGLVLDPHRGAGALIEKDRGKDTFATLMCSWSCAWCCRVRFSCCFWNSAMRSCFWICCCCWMRSSSCCSCFSRTTGSTTGIIILRSVLRSKGEMGSRPIGTSDFTSTGDMGRKTEKGRGRLEISTLICKQTKTKNTLSSPVLISTHREEGAQSLLYTEGKTYFAHKFWKRSQFTQLQVFCSESFYRCLFSNRWIHLEVSKIIYKVY